MAGERPARAHHRAGGSARAVAGVCALPGTDEAPGRLLPRRAAADQGWRRAGNTAGDVRSPITSAPTVSAARHVSTQTACAIAPTGDAVDDSHGAGSHPQPLPSPAGVVFVRVKRRRAAMVRNMDDQLNTVLDDAVSAQPTASDTGAGVRVELQALTAQTAAQPAQASADTQQRPVSRTGERWDPAIHATPPSQVARGTWASCRRARRQRPSRRLNKLPWLRKTTAPWPSTPVRRCWTWRCRCRRRWSGSRQRTSASIERHLTCFYERYPGIAPICRPAGAADGCRRLRVAACHSVAGCAGAVGGVCSGGACNNRQTRRRRCERRHGQSQPRCEPMLHNWTIGGSGSGKTTLNKLLWRGFARADAQPRCSIRCATADGTAIFSRMTLRRFGSGCSPNESANGRLLGRSGHQR